MTGLSIWQIVAVFAVILTFFYKLTVYLITHWKLYQSLKQFPTFQKGHSSLTGLLQVTLSSGLCVDPHLVKELVAEFSKDETAQVIPFWMGPFPPLLILNDIKLVKAIFTEHLNKSTQYAILAAGGFGNSLVTCPGAQVPEIRKLFAPYFKVSSLASYISALESTLQAFNRRLDVYIDHHSGICENVKPLLSNYASDSAGATLLNENFHSLETTLDPPLLHSTEFAARILDTFQFQPWRNIFHEYPLISKLYSWFFSLNLELARKFLYYVWHAFAFIRQAYKRVKNREAQEAISAFPGKTLQRQIILLDDLTQVCINQQSTLFAKVSGIFTMFAHFTTLIGASHQTTVSFLSWFLYCLHHHPDVYKKLQNEIDAFLASLSSKTPVTVHSLRSLEYLKVCIKETFRLYPSAFLISRHTSTAVPLPNGQTIPKSVDVAIFIQLIHRQARYFREPTRFYPERWLLGQAPTDNGEPWCTEEALIPFSLGSRTCPGKDFAQLSIQLFVVNLLGKFDFTALKMGEFGEDIKPTHCVVQTPAEYSIQFRKRTSCISVLQK